MSLDYSSHDFETLHWGEGLGMLPSLLGLVVL